MLRWSLKNGCKAGFAVDHSSLTPFEVHAPTQIYICMYIYTSSDKAMRIGLIECRDCRISKNPPEHHSKHIANHLHRKMNIYARHFQLEHGNGGAKGRAGDTSLNGKSAIVSCLHWGKGSAIEMDRSSFE